MGKPEKRVVLSLESEEAVVMGLKTIKALGDSLLCIGVAGDAVSLWEDTIGTLGNLIFDKADEVWKGLEGTVI